MGNDLLVKYDNRMNLLAFKDLEKIEADLFFSILARFKNKGTETLTLDFSEIAELLKGNYTNAQISKMIHNGVGKIVRTAVRWQMAPHKTAYFTLFNKFVIDDQNLSLTANINDLFLEILNNFDNGGFTTFELAEFSSLKSKYTQTLYRLLRQFKSTGYRSINWVDFLEIMDISQSYDMGSIERQILKPATKELSKIFKNLIYKKIRGTTRGRPVEKIEFYFTAKKKNQIEQRKADRALEVIANNIKSEQVLKQLKRADNAPKQIPKNILTSEPLTEFEQYTSAVLKMKNKFSIDSLKIINISQNPIGEIFVKAQNVDDGYLTELKFENLKHFENTFKKFKI